MKLSRVILTFLKYLCVSGIARILVRRGRVEEFFSSKTLANLILNIFLFGPIFFERGGGVGNPPIHSAGRH